MFVWGLAGLFTWWMWQRREQTRAKWGTLGVFASLVLAFFTGAIVGFILAVMLLYASQEIW